VIKLKNTKDLLIPLRSTEKGMLLLWDSCQKMQNLNQLMRILHQTNPMLNDTLYKWLVCSKNVKVWS
jgi:hypothetical protein